MNDKYSDATVSKTDRRGFIKGAAAAGLLGLAPAVTSAAAPQATVEDPQKPAGLGSMGLPDGRFPMMYETSVPEAVRVLTQYFKALSQRDLRALSQTVQYPFASYEGTDPVVIETAEELIAKAPPSMNMSENPERFTDHDGYIKAGSYDVFGGIEIFNSDNARVNLALTYDRYGKDGKRMLRCEGIYCVTNNDGKWGIQLMSTIFTPSDMVGTVYEDTIMACARLREDHCLAFQVNEGNDFARTVQFGKVAAMADVSYSLLQNNAINGNPMATYKVKGVKTRLITREVSEESVLGPGPAPISANLNNPGNPQTRGNRGGNGDFSRSARELYARIGHGIKWGFVSGAPIGHRVVHHSMDKAHMYSGVTRFTPAGEEINTTMELDVVTYKKSHWGIPGAPLTFAYITTHDRVNDLDSV
ncbi:MAG TPA: hypothetical protein VN788_10095 [Verrucomicrobiae bacterium]|nr:hypothetical protein [Verrucomicrobiae bacterium]